MASATTYHPGGFNPSAPAQNRAEHWDTAGGYTRWDTTGTQVEQRALTSQESAALAAQDADLTTSTNASTTRTALQASLTRLTQIRTQADTLAATTGTRTGAQLSGDVRALATAVSDLALIERRLIRQTLALNEAVD